jgi:IclR family pca regulon transcriptional regulator
MSRAAARRFLLTLESLGYVGSDQSQRFYLRSAALSLGYAYLSSMAVEESVQPVLQEAEHSSGCSCSMAVLDDLDVVYVARAAAKQRLQVDIRVGDRLPAHTTSLGRILMAQFDKPELSRRLRRTTRHKFTERTITDPARLAAVIMRARRDGWTLVDGEQLLGLVSIAVPVRDDTDRIVAAVNLSTQDQRKAGELAQTGLPILKRAAAAIEQTLRVLDIPLRFG